MQIAAKYIVTLLCFFGMNMQTLSSQTWERAFSSVQILGYVSFAEVQSKRLERAIPGYNQLLGPSLKTPFSKPKANIGYGLGLRGNMGNIGMVDVSYEKNESQIEAVLNDGSEYTTKLSQSGLMCLMGFKIAGSKPIYGAITIGAWMMTQNQESKFTAGTAFSQNLLSSYLTNQGKVFEFGAAAGFYLGTNFKKSPVNLFGRYILSMRSSISDLYDHRLTGA
ncbi:MAG: hypothetical protein ACRCYO_11495, partial [Bacteroidia bacterium]